MGGGRWVRDCQTEGMGTGRVGEAVRERVWAVGEESSAARNRSNMLSSRVFFFLKLY